MRWRYGLCDVNIIKSQRFNSANDVNSVDSIGCNDVCIESSFRVGEGERVVIAIPCEDCDIISGSAPDCVVTWASEQTAIAIVSVQVIVSGSAIKSVIAFVVDQPVIAAFAVYDVAVVPAMKGVVSVASVESVVMPSSV